MLSMLQTQLLISIKNILGLLVEYMLQHYSILVLICVSLEVLPIPGGMDIYRVIGTLTLEKGHMLHSLHNVAAVLLVHKVFKGTQGGVWDTGRCLGCIGCV